MIFDVKCSEVLAEALAAAGLRAMDERLRSSQSVTVRCATT